uniref:Transthyretin-like family protein n=1 Tax=Parascaris univalens TaxID=6257 RepID=A0A915C4C6_PARUN
MVSESCLMISGEMKLITIAAFAVVFTSCDALVGRTQSAGVKGVLKCNGKPAANVKVKLYDDDRGIDADDLMAEGKSDQQGSFELKGHTDEFTTIDPKLNVYHDCEDGLKPCQRKITIVIPDSYVSSGKTPKKIYDAGTIELAGKFKGEERDCLN